MVNKFSILVDPPSELDSMGHWELHVLIYHCENIVLGLSWVTSDMK